MPKGKKKDYDLSSLNLALRELRETENPNIREIARKYCVPKSTLHFKYKNPEHRTSFGPRPILTEEEESVLEIWIKRLMRKGLPLKVENLQRSVSKFLEENPRPNPFKDNYPGDGWVKAFLKRHPDIVHRTSEGVTQSSACVSEKDIRKWFTEIHQYLEEIGLLHILDDPSRVFNGDESGFQLCPKTGKVLAVKGTKNVYNIDTNNSKETITVMFTFSASGEACPPMVVYNYQRIPQKIADGIPKGWGVGRSDNGWMTSELFFEYVGNIFHPYLLEKGIQLPVIFFLDGHKTHLTYNVSKLCKELGIELIALYPNATRILQPADVAVFRPVKAAWKDKARTWLMNNPGESITKVNFASILEEALKKSIQPETLIHGFRACGLMPFNPDAIDYDKCLGSNKHNQANDHQNGEHVITFSQFSQIVGSQKLTQLKTSKNSENSDENFQILCEIYKAFLTSPSSLKQALVPETTIVSQNLTPEIHDTDPVVEERVFSDDLIQVSDLVDSNVSAVEFNTITNGDFQDMIREPTSNFQNYELHESRSNCTAEDNFSVSELLLQDSGLNISTHKTPVKEVTPIAPVAQDQELIPNVSCVTEKSPAFKIISNSQFAPFLTLPKTPERKGKRNTVRFPFAITSDKYRAMCKDQKDKKESALKIKEERKKIREENKLKRLGETKENLKQCGNKKIEKCSTNTCKICLKSTKTSNRLTCDMCSSIFHVKCVPSKHQQHVPEDITIDLYVCHDCYKEESNDDNDDIMSFEEGSEDLEANMIYEWYRKDKT